MSCMTVQSAAAVTLMSKYCQVMFTADLICDPGAQNQLSRWGIFVAIAKNIVWFKIMHFYFMSKIIRILRSCSMMIFSEFHTVNISKLNFLLVNA